MSPDAGAAVGREAAGGGAVLGRGCSVMVLAAGAAVAASAGTASPGATSPRDRRANGNNVSRLRLYTTKDSVG